MTQSFYILLAYVNRQDAKHIERILGAGDVNIILKVAPTQEAVASLLNAYPWSFILVDEGISPPSSATLNILNLLKLHDESLPVISLLPAADEMRIRGLLKAGASHFILKPNLRQKLVPILKDVIRERQCKSHQDLTERFTPAILGAFLQESLDVIWAKDLKGRYLLINQAGSKFLGKPVDEIIGRDDTVLFAPETVKKIQASDQKVMMSGETQFIEDQLVNREGEKRVYLAMKAPFRDESGKTQGVIGIIRDISQRKRAEDALRHSEDKYKRLYAWEKSAREIAQLLSLSSEPTKVYPKLVENVGMLLKADRCFIIHYEDHVEAAFQGFEFVRDKATRPFTATTPLKSVITSFEALMKSAPAHHPVIQVEDVDSAALSGSIRQILELHQAKGLIAVPISYQNNVLALLALETFEPRHWTEHEAFFLQTVASQVAITLYQAQSIQTLEKATLYKSMFLANLSHEFRTPLNAIIGYSDMLQLDIAGPLNDKQQKYLSHIRTSGQHLLSLINDILDLSKVESGKIELHPEVVRLSSLISESVNVMRSMAEKKGISLQMLLEDEDIYLEVDPVRFKQILFNLLSNAIKFSDKAGTVSVKTYLDLDKCLIISVTDMGIGIAKEDYSRIFLEFVQLDNTYSRKQDGTGLGLALTRKLVEAHGGQISFSSKLNEGTTFTIKMPHYTLFESSQVSLHPQASPAYVPEKTF